MKLHPPVPRLNLAPKLKRPLSLWNPLDYLRLLYWVFYFPQALRWYVDTFGGGYIPAREMNWGKGWEILQRNSIQRQLFLQSLILTVVTPLALCLLLQQIGVSVDWYGVAYGVAIGVANGVTFGVAFGVANGVTFGVAFGVAILRLENWLIGLLFNLRLPQNGNWRIPHVTPLPLPYLAIRLQNWLQQDWETGVHNANQLLAYTLQFIPVVKAVNKVLAQTPSEEIIWRVSRLAEAPFDWKLVGFASNSWQSVIFSYQPKISLDTPPRATAAGFWYLHEKQPAKAMAAFAVIRHLLYGEEMFTLAQILATFYKTREIASIMEIPPPPDGDLLNFPLPTFRRYLAQIIETFPATSPNGTSPQGLIIALDEFEKIEELIETGKIPIDFMGFLRGLAQKSPKIAFVFAGLHTLEEMTGNYFQPFYASVTPPIKVSFMTPAATHQILANPAIEDFPLDYTPEALNLIYTLTSGQPYLVQLMGFQLVRLYNDFVFEQGKSRNPIFTIEDVEAVINNPEFFNRGRYYFDGVWGQAAQGAENQQLILKTLAPYPEGLDIDMLSQLTNMNAEILQEALTTLKRHDGVEEKDGYWRIVVELFRRWVLTQIMH